MNQHLNAPTAGLPRISRPTSRQLRSQMALALFESPSIMYALVVFGSKTMHVPGSTVTMASFHEIVLPSSRKSFVVEAAIFGSLHPGYQPFSSSVSHSTHPLPSHTSSS